MKLPKFTSAQFFALIGFIASQAVAYGWLSPGQGQSAVSVAGIVLPGVLMVVDAIIHHAYAKINVAQLVAEGEKTWQALHASQTNNPVPPVVVG